MRAVEVVHPSRDGYRIKEWWKVPQSVKAGWKEVRR